MCVCVCIYIPFLELKKKMKGYSHAMVLWSVPLMSSPSMAAVAESLSHTKPDSARCPHFFCSLTYLHTGLAPGENTRFVQIVSGLEL